MTIQLYHSGLTDTATICEQEGKSTTEKLDRDYNVEVEVKLPPKGHTWYVIEK